MENNQIKIQVHGKGRWYDVDGKKMKCICTTVTFINEPKMYLRHILPPNESFWYNPQTKTSLPQLLTHHG